MSGGFEAVPATHRELLEKPTVRESRLYTIEGEKARCLTCERRCLIPPGRTGYCRTRMNVEGKIYTLVYGDISSISVNPIEKKPFFHFWPGSRALTVGSWGCNQSCSWCQNFEISKTPPNPKTATYTSPEDLVRIASSSGCHGVSLSFNEPTLLLEYALDLFPLAKSLGLNTSYVSNGYMTVQALRRLRDSGLDAVKFDVKGDAGAVRRFCDADVDLVWRNVREAKGLGMHVEVVVLLIPGINDREESIMEVVQRHLEYAGHDTPIHFTRFHPDYLMLDRGPTPLEKLERAYSIAKNQGVDYVYLGNCPGHRYEDTYCHSCGELLIKRSAFKIVECKVGGDCLCPACGQRIPITGVPIHEPVPVHDSLRRS
ncbi:MAG: AmmeMemoRadiSam system radical SAM enzyme [Candidatus Bathyarchaeia archaeon]